MLGKLHPVVHGMLMETVRISKHYNTNPKKKLVTIITPR